MVVVLAHDKRESGVRVLSWCKLMVNESGVSVLLCCKLMIKDSLVWVCCCAVSL